MWHNVTCQGLFGGYIVSGSTAFQRSKGKLYAETFRCPGGALCLDFCNSGGGTRSASGTEWIASFTDLVDWLEAAAAVTGSQAARLRQAGAGSPPAPPPGWGRGIQFPESPFPVLERQTQARPAPRRGSPHNEATP